LSLRGKRLNDDWSLAVLASPFAELWREFYLEGPELSDTVCEGLSRSPLVESGCRVTLMSTSISERGRRLLEQVLGSRLQFFDHE
jgi:hypothetical protein